MKKLLSLLLALGLLSLTGCETDDLMTHHTAHIGGWIGVVDTQSNSLSGLDGYQNISTYFYPQHDEYVYFVKKYIFENWDSKGPSGKAQFWRDKFIGDSDWIEEKMPGENGGWDHIPFTKEIHVENGYMSLIGSSWQQPWKSWKWKIKSVSDKEIVLVNEQDKYFFKITKGDKIAPAEAYDEESKSNKYRQ